MKMIGGGGTIGDFYLKTDYEVLRQRFGAPRSARIGFSTESLDCILPKPAIRTWDWICDNIYTQYGEPFNPIDYPYCEGVCDEWDNPRRRTIVLQWAARAGKTVLAMSMMICAMRNDPNEALLATEGRKLLTEQTAKYYKMLDKCPSTRHVVPSNYDRVQDKVVVGSSEMFGAWSGSVATLADKGPKYSHANEIDKWVRDKSKEGSREEDDPEGLFDERGIERPDRKQVKESTPTIEGISRVNRNLVKGTNCRFFIPCPKCGRFHQIIDGKGRKGEGGIIWDGGREASQQQARDTARYLCGFCNQEWGDEYRRGQVQRGLWVADGQYVRRGRVCGTPKNDGPIASFQLARFYAPSFTFGEIAAKIVDCHRTKKWQGYDNSWKGVTHAPRIESVEWEAVAQRISQAYKFGTCPLHGCFVTVGIDVQVDYFVYAVMAWGKHGVGWIIDYGIIDTWDEVAQICSYGYEHEDGGQSLPAAQSLVDARDGNRTHEVVAKCREIYNRDRRRVFPCMNERSEGKKAWRRIDPSDREQANAIQKKGRNVFCQVMISHGFYQTWIHNALYNLSPGDPHSIAIPDECADDQNLMEQLLNEKPTPKADRTKHVINEWHVINSAIPWDLRDAVRMARTAADMHTGGDWERVKRRVNKQRPGVVESRRLPQRGQAV